MNPDVGDSGRAEEMEQDLPQAAQASRLAGQTGAIRLNDEIFRVVEALDRRVRSQFAAQDLLRVVVDQRLPRGPSRAQALYDGVQRDDVDLALGQERVGLELLDYDLVAHATEARGLGDDGWTIVRQGRGLGFWPRRADLNRRCHPRASPRPAAASVIASTRASKATGLATRPFMPAAA